MSRIRTIKPEFFKHDELFEAEKKCNLPLRLAFIGLLTNCDRAGRFRWKPRQLKIDVLPYDEVDFEAVLNALASSGFIAKYEVDAKFYGCFLSWDKHQWINNKESGSDLPAFEPSCEVRVDDACFTRGARVKKSTESSHKEGEGKGKEGNNKGKGKEGERCSQERCEPESVISIISIISIPLNNQSDYSVSQAQVDEWQTLYPSVDVSQELRNIRGWNLSHPEKRKTQSGILKHINTWLSKAQNHPKRNYSNRSPPFSSHSVSLYEYNQQVADDWLKKSENCEKPEKVEKGQIIEGELVNEA